MALMPAGLAGCDALNSVDPVSWYHSLEGGAIAEQRPPPPNSNAPYPNLGSVPNRPTANDSAARSGIASRLIADRANALYAAQIDPVPATPPLRAPLPAPATPAGNSNASLAAAAAPAAPKAAPVAPVSSAPLPPAPPSAPDVGPMPAVPNAPPPPPSLPGVVASTAPTATPTKPPATPPPPPQAGAPVAIAFQAGSAILTTDAVAALKTLARQRGGGAVNVVGFGEATGTAPPDQAAALPLALARARAISTQLVLDGVPANAVRIDAEASGTGAAARIVR